MNRAEDMLREIIESGDLWFPVFGEITAFSPTAGTVSVRPAITRQSENAPVMKDVPLLMPGGGGWHIDFQPAAGDFALVIFCGQPVGNFWNRNGKTSEFGRATLSDAVAIPFSRRTSSTDGIVLKNDLGNLSIELTDTDIAVTALSAISSTTFSLLTHTHSVPTGQTGPPTAGS
jgi:hypothetical protein